ncbi:beta-1,3-galactosyltransferase 5-like isoform X2 [Convolutriloba macropyga]|uniref:beta-1,3-galactosyltransferase 5-like isoform X2 n=1 Tax=Convolutriloba macropyga TaxID=536237 RepID=UPI003F525315
MQFLYSVPLLKLLRYFVLIAFILLSLELNILPFYSPHFSGTIKLLKNYNQPGGQFVTSYEENLDSNLSQLKFVEFLKQRENSTTSSKEIGGNNLVGTGRTKQTGRTENNYERPAQPQNFSINAPLYDYHRVWTDSRPPIWINTKTFNKCDRLPTKVAIQRKVLILVTSQATNYERRQIIRKTWASESNLRNLKNSSGLVSFKVVFVVGKDINPKSGLRLEQKAYGDVIEADIKETYQNLTLKVQMGIDFAVNECGNFDYVIKTDDDMYLNIFPVSLFLSKQGEGKRLFGGRCYYGINRTRIDIDKYYVSDEDYPGRTYPPFCAGAFYIMSTDVAKDVRKHFRLIRPVALEDVYTALCLKNMSFEPNVKLDSFIDNAGVLPYISRSVANPNVMFAVHFE